MSTLNNIKNKELKAIMTAVAGGNEPREYEFFNQTIKDGFLNNYQGDSRNTYARIFIISKPIEEALKKDLYDFNLREMELLLKECEPLTLASSKHNGHIISAYINWAIKTGTRENETNPIDNVEKSWFNKFVDDTNELYISEKEIIKIERDLHNYQDKVIPRLLFEGVGGEACAELLNLQKKDVDFNTRTLTLYEELGNQETKRQLIVTQRAIDFIRGALGEYEYLKNNGDLSPNIKAKYTKLVPHNGFVIRSSITKNDDFYAPAKIHTVFRRLQMISQQWDKPYFNATNINRSGMIKKAYDLLLEYNQLEKPQYELICKDFNVPKVFNGGAKLEYNYYPLKDFLNIEEIDKLYNFYEERIAL